jgi:O-antigen ligase
MMTVSTASLNQSRMLRAVGGLTITAILSATLLVNFFIGGHDRQRCIELVGVLLCATCALASRQSSPGLLSSARLPAPLFAFFVLGALSSILAFAPQFAFYEVSILLLLCLCAQLLGHEISHRGTDTLLSLARMIALSCALYSLNFVVAYLASFYLGQAVDSFEFWSGFSNVRFFNHTQTATLPLLILLGCVGPRHSKLKPLWLAIASYWWMALFATSGRGTLLGVAAGCILIAILRRQAALPYLKAAAVSAALGLLAYLVFMVAIPSLAGGNAFGAFSSVVDRTVADPASGRLVLWRRALGLVSEYPWLGAGPLHFAHRAVNVPTAAHPHDWILQVASEWGIPALLCLCAAIVHAFQALLRAGRKLAADDTVNQAIFSALLMGGAAILVDGMVSGLFVMPQSQLAITLYLGCAIGWCRIITPPPAGKTTTGPVQGAMKRLVIAAAMMGVIVGVWPDVPARFHETGQNPVRAALNTGTHWPRLWEAGFF